MGRGNICPDGKYEGVVYKDRPGKPTVLTVG